MPFSFMRSKNEENEPAPAPRSEQPAIAVPAPVAVPAPAAQAAPEPKPRREPSMSSIGKSIVVVGEVTGEEDLLIDGRVEGRVELPDHRLTIGPNGFAEGELRAKEIIVMGRVDGDLQAIERISIEDAAHVEGDLTAPRLLIKEGAVLNGRMSMASPEGFSRQTSAGAVRPPRPQPVTSFDSGSRAVDAPKAAAVPKAAAAPKIAAPKVAAPKVAAPKAAAAPQAAVARQKN